jgi:hypothetical protein
MKQQKATYTREKEAERLLRDPEDDKLKICLKIFIFKKK